MPPHPLVHGAAHRRDDGGSGALARGCGHPCLSTPAAHLGLPTVDWGATSLASSQPVFTKVKSEAWGVGDGPRPQSVSAH